MSKAPALTASSAPLRYRETVLDKDALGWIQGLVDGAPGLARAHLATLVCQRFGWLRPDGAVASSSCSVFLGRLARRGIIRLAERQQPMGPRRRMVGLHQEHRQFLRCLGTIPGLVECQPYGPLTVRPIVPEERDGFWLHLERYHYLGFNKGVGESLCYAAFLGNELVALLVWGSAVPHSSHRDQLIGWDAPTRRLRLPYVVNNARFLVLPWVRLPHLASRILGANLRRLSRDWQQAYGHPVYLAETFVDLARFKGTCYRASNWRHLGLTQGYSRSRHAPKGFFPNHRPKGVFVYPLHRRALPLLRGEVALRTEPPPC